MREVASAMGMGLLAGLGVAMPLGAIGILLIHEGVSAGIRHGLPAAVGVASVDGLYALASVVVGNIVAPEVRRLGALPEVLGGVVLIVIAVVGIRRRSPTATTALPNRRTRTGRRFLVFFGLTAINPATFVYFSAVTVSIGPLPPVARIAFVVGVIAASLSWQSGLVTVGALLGSRVGSRVRRGLTIMGYVVVGVLGAVLAVAGMAHP
ncbi:LysE family transporter [Gordonia sp. L191]|uniref:LysE family transporter n=1 Tax=Gordonia sp. L191 TaxID=2982699 RepID=UPI0024BF4AD9|nr:LysE family transporter [Gordonia sp. L191]WHU49175.1 LysE family transporter [Gordonia sp. L191]